MELFAFLAASVEYFRAVFAFEAIASIHSVFAVKNLAIIRRFLFEVFQYLNKRKEERKLEREGETVRETRGKTRQTDRENKTEGK